METKYHISPKTDRPAVCRARKKPCSFEHFSSEAEALGAIEHRALEAANGSLPAPQSRVSTSAPPLGELRVAHEKKSDSYHYQELWIRDQDGKSTVYVKVNLMSWGAREDGSIGRKPGVVLCDVEINPEAQGKGYALSTLRRLKEAYGAEAIEFTGTFSEAGYAMFQRMRAEEERTGEKLVAIQHGERLQVPPAGESYSFVRDWATEEAKYRL